MLDLLFLCPNDNAKIRIIFDMTKCFMKKVSFIFHGGDLRLPVEEAI